jgi:hypothetical protein
MSSVESINPRGKFSPFSNGFEFRMWTDRNCARGEGGCRNWNPKASSSRHGCPIECALALASCTDGEIKAGIGLRGGFLDPGPNGTLVRAEGDASTWRCPEYKGRDEPDDRPRRGPRPPADQLDLLDPRNVPERVEAIA